MRLVSIAVRDFKKLAGSWRIGPLDPGLTVIGGDNEEGKSTVLAALKAALLEPWSVGGRVRDAMNPHTGGSPSVAVAFELGGVGYRVEKEFGRGCTLLWPGGRRVGDEAEAELQRLLRFEPRKGRAERRPEHQGLLALFWVDQGTSFLEATTAGAIEAQRDRLAAALRREIGVVTGGPQLARLRERIEAGHGRFWTERGQEKRNSELAGLRVEIERLEREAASLRAARQRYDATVDALERARAEQDRAMAPERRARVRERLQRAIDELARIERLEQERALAAKAVEAAGAEFRRLEEEARTRAERCERLARDEAALRALEAERDRLVERTGEAEARLRELEQAQQRATEAAVEARRQLALARAARELVERRGEAERLREALAEADGKAGAIDRYAAELAAFRIDDAALRRLQERAGEVDRHEAGLLAQATRIELLPEPGRAARTAEGVAIDPSRPLDLTAPSELLLDGFGRIRIVPGGDLAARRQALADARTRLAAALAELGVASLAEARDALDRRRELEQKLAAERRMLAGLLRGVGVADLESLRTRLQVELRRLENGRQSLGEGADPAALAAAHDGAVREVEEAERRLEQLRAEAGAAGRAVGALREQAAGLEGRRRELVRAVEAAREATLAAQARLSDRDLEAELAAAKERHAAGLARLSALESELARLDAEGVRARKEQAEREAADLDAEAARCRQAVAKLEGEVQGLGIEACDSRLDEIERALAGLRPRLAALAREADAWKLLRASLAAAERQGAEQLVEPVGRRLLPYLRRLLPEAAIAIDPERLVPTHLRRGDVEEPLAELSVGTREQLAVLVRLALAELLLEREGEAPCLVLDDALVFADEGRFETMKTILAKAAQRLQILVLTCRPRDWLGLPGAVIRLETCRLADEAGRVAARAGST